MSRKFHSSLTWTGILITVCAIMVNMVIFFVAHIMGENFLIPYSENNKIETAIPVMVVLIATLIPSVLAIILFGVLRKIARRSFLPAFVSVSITALIVSFGGPASLPDSNLQTKIILFVMHIISALIIIGGLVLFHKRDSQSAK